MKSPMPIITNRKTSVAIMSVDPNRLVIAAETPPVSA